MVHQFSTTEGDNCPLGLVEDIQVIRFKHQPGPLRFLSNSQYEHHQTHTHAGKLLANGSAVNSSENSKNIVFFNWLKH